MIKNPPANSGDTGDAGLIPGSRRSPGGRNSNPLQSSCLGTEEPGGLQSTGSQRVGHNLVTDHAHTTMNTVGNTETNISPEGGVLDLLLGLLSRFSRVQLCATP